MLLNVTQQRHRPPISSRVEGSRREVSPEETKVHSERSRRAFQVKREGARTYNPGEDDGFPTPTLDPSQLMPPLPKRGLSAVSLFSGGGGLDLGFELAGFEHAGSWEIVEAAAQTLKANRPAWLVHGGESGDVRNVDWRHLSGAIDVVHGGPPCQPFSSAGNQLGALDKRDMWPEFVRAVLEIQPRAFVAENVAALSHERFRAYRDEFIFRPLSDLYDLHTFVLKAESFGVPQSRRRFFVVGFLKTEKVAGWEPPVPTHSGYGQTDLLTPPTPGLRQALGLPDIGKDAISPTIRCAWTGPRGTTSILSSASAARKFAELEVWPNGVALTRHEAAAFPARDGHYRLSVSEVALLQGFPKDWSFVGSAYMQLGQIGNSVAPPVAYNVAKSVATVLGGQNSQP